jgi:uncharacterized protein YndB with AHSA1/START domain
MPDIIHKIGINAPMEQVNAALSTAEGVAGWWTRETRAGRPSPDELKIDNWN